MGAVRATDLAWCEIHCLDAVTTNFWSTGFVRQPRRRAGRAALPTRALARVGARGRGRAPGSPRTRASASTRSTLALVISAPCAGRSESTDRTRGAAAARTLPPSRSSRPTGARRRFWCEEAAGPGGRAMLAGSAWAQAAQAARTVDRTRERARLELRSRRMVLSTSAVIAPGPRRLRWSRKRRCSGMRSHDVGVGGGEPVRSMQRCRRWSRC